MTRFAEAWVFMGLALGLHVADEAAHDFLAWYNPVARRIRAHLAPLPFPPTFTFWPWLVGLLAATVAMLALTGAVSARPAWARDVAVVIAAINVGNALLHLGSTAWLRRRVPGVLSAPVLLAAAIWLWAAAL